MFNVECYMLSVECRLSAEGSGPPGLCLRERKLSTRESPFFIFSRQAARGAKGNDIY